MKQKAFTLIELLVVISIISLLSSIVYSATGEARNKAQDAAAKQEVKNVTSALSLYKNDAPSMPLASGATAGELYSSEDIDNDYFEESMQILVDGGYLSSIPKTVGNIVYTYGTSSDGESAVFGAGLNYEYVSSGSSNNCNVSFDNVNTEGGIAPLDPCYRIGIFPGNCDSPPPAFTGYQFPWPGQEDKEFCVDVRGNEETNYFYCSCSGGVGFARDIGYESAQELTDSICQYYYNPDCSFKQEIMPPASGSDFWACTVDEGTPVSGACDGSNGSDYCGCI